MKPLLITVSSLILTSAVIGHAYYQKKQFFPTVVHITKSNPGISVLYLQVFILMVMVGKLLKKLFFGELRQIEVEHLVERSWYTVTETCLAFTVFRDDFTPKFVALFVILFFLKSFHWLAEERVDFMERSPVISLLFHVRIISLLAVLSSLDVNFITYAYHSTVTKGPSVQLVFGFEYAVLMTVVMYVVIKYILHFVDLHRHVPWEHKAVFLLYTELIISFIKVSLYALFAFVMFRMYTLPVFVLRSMYYTVREFRKAFSDVILSRRAIRNMNTLYPDATAEELSAEDNLCIICREEMQVGIAAKKLPCNHIFHTTCLRSWFQRQQTCPTCRLNILRTPTIVNSQDNQPPQERDPVQQNVAAGQPNIPSRSQQNTSSSHNLQGSAIPSSSSLPDVNQRFFPPFPQMTFPITPLVPNFESLSDDDLRNLERQTREGVEARLRYLQNIQTLLDTSTVMMQQYSSIISLANRNNKMQGPNTEPVTTSDRTLDSSNCGNDKYPVGPSGVKNISTVSEHQSPNVCTEIPKEASDGSADSSSSSEGSTLSHDQNVIRQRRLEKFAKFKRSSD